jgi:hypothetical protein
MVRNEAPSTFNQGGASVALTLLQQARMPLA